MSSGLTDSVVSEQVDARHWRVVLGRLHATFATESFTRGLGFVARLAELAEQANHHPDVDLRYAGVHVSLVSHDSGGLTERDVNLARHISELADELGIEGRPDAPQALEIAIDALDIPAVRPFWRAALEYVDGGPSQGGEPSTELVDPAGIGPGVWFQQMEEPRGQRNRIHLDVWVPHDVAAQRVQSVIDAGGRLVTDHHAPAWWVLADVEGNEACICTWQAQD